MDTVGLVAIDNDEQVARVVEDAGGDGPSVVSSAIGISVLTGYGNRLSIFLRQFRVFVLEIRVA